MNRVIEKNKPKQHILEMMCKKFFSENDIERAVVTIKADKATRSDKQNRLYWEWVNLIGKELGYKKDETHVLLRDKFLGYNEYKSKKGEDIRELRSTTKLNTTEFKDYLEQIDYLVADYGIVLPHPEDLYYAAMGIKR